MSNATEFVPEEWQKVATLQQTLLELERSKQMEEETRIESDSILACLNALATVGSHKNALKILLERLRPIFEYDEAFVLVPDSQDVEQYVAIASTHCDFQDSRWPAHGVQSCMTMHQPLVTADIQTIPLWQAQDDTLQGLVGSALHIALRSTPRPAYLIGTHPQVGFFKPQHARRAIRLAPIAAQALMNIELTEELSIVNRRLEQEAEERCKAQKALRQTQEQLVATARQAGMAEIATNVVHNIGNVLNSVNVGAEALERCLQGMPLQYLHRMKEMVAEHQHVVANHDKMKLLPNVLEKLTHTFEQQHQNCCDELATLHKRIDHITNIVKLQQESAGCQEALEIVEPSRLMESALQINFGDPTHSNIGIVRQYQDLSHCRLNKHKVLQILVNLISNAKQAIAELDEVEGKLTLTVEAEEHHLCFKVEDNGEGIESDKLEEIFKHGYTTRRKGNGFGLHSSALNAKQLGGSLNALSPGKNQGSEFTLMIPWASPEDS